MHKCGPCTSALVNDKAAQGRAATAIRSDTTLLRGVSGAGLGWAGLVCLLLGCLFLWWCLGLYFSRASVGFVTGTLLHLLTASMVGGFPPISTFLIFSYLLTFVCVCGRAFIFMIIILPLVSPRMYPSVDVRWHSDLQK